MGGFDFGKPGASSGYLHLHNSTNESAWQSVRLPVHCFNGGDGPTTLLLGGMHGDEYEGPVAIANLCASIDVSKLTGRIIAIPAINLPALMAGARLSPVDGLNMNRIFPGDARGSLSHRIARMITDELVPLADHVIDLHSGGKTLRFEPCTLLHELPDPAVMQKAMGAAKAFGAPLTVVLREDHADMMLDAVVEGAGKVMISSELGGAGMLTAGTAKLANEGLWRALSALGHFEPEGELPATRTVIIPQENAHIFADDHTLFEPFVALGEVVAEGQQIGRLHHIDRVGREADAVIATMDGLIACLSGQGNVQRGDVICVLAQDYDAAS